MDQTIELNLLTCICFVCVTRKLNVSSIQHNRRLVSSGKSRNNNNSTQSVVEEFEGRNDGRKQHRPTKTQTTPARPCNTSFNGSCDNNIEFGDEMLADGKASSFCSLGLPTENVTGGCRGFKFQPDTAPLRVLKHVLITTFCIISGCFHHIFSVHF